MKQSLLALLAFGALMPATASADVSKAYVSDLGNGKYQNPVINADYSDPDVIRVGNDYWMTSSSFANLPALQILHSNDLVNWTIVGAVAETLPDAAFDGVSHGNGVWAPAIRYHDGWYYVMYGDPDRGIYIAKTQNPRGKWEPLQLIYPAVGVIDPCPFWDEDGKAYIAHGYAGSRAGVKSIIGMIEMKPDATGVIGQDRVIYDGHLENETIEGAKMYKRGDWYYIFSPAGGVPTGWQVVMRSKSPWGPYEQRNVCEQGDTDINGPHQGALVTAPDGHDWFLHFQDKGVYGRVLHLNPVEWVDGWPVIGHNDGQEAGTPVARHAMPVAGTRQQRPTSIKDGFDSIHLARQWEWAANRHDWFGFATPSGYYRLNSAQLDSDTANLWTVPNLLLQKFPGKSFTVTTRVTACCKSCSNGFMGGLLMMGYDYGFLALQYSDGAWSLVEGTCKDSDQGSLQHVETLVRDIPSSSYEAGLYPNLSAAIYLRAHVADGGLVSWSYSLDGTKFTRCGTPFQARQGKWVGAKTGVFSTVPPRTERGWVNIDSFDITDIKY